MFNPIQESFETKNSLHSALFPLPFNFIQSMCTLKEDYYELHDREINNLYNIIERTRQSATTMMISLLLLMLLSCRNRHVTHSQTSDAAIMSAKNVTDIICNKQSNYLLHHTISGTLSNPSSLLVPQNVSVVVPWPLGWQSRRDQLAVAAKMP